MYEATTSEPVALIFTKIAQSALLVTPQSGPIGSSLPLATTGGSGSGAVSYSVTNGTAAGCAVVAGRLVATTAGTCMVTATKAADSMYGQISSSAMALTFSKISQTTLHLVTGAGVVGTPLLLSTTGGSGSGGVSYSVTNGTATGCAVVAGRLVAKTAGTCVVTATKGGDSKYFSTSSPSTSLNLTKRAQSPLIVVTGAGVVGTALLLKTTGGSGSGTVSYSVTNGTATGCAVVAGRLVAKTAGTCFVTATKNGDGLYRSMTSTTKLIRMNQSVSQPALFVVGDFVTGSSNLTSSMRHKLQVIAKTIGARRFTRVVVRGYSSSSGSLSANQALSQARAAAASSYLESQLAAYHVSGVTVTFVGAGLGTNPRPMDNQMVTVTCRN